MTTTGIPLEYSEAETMVASFPGQVDSKNNTANRQLGLVLIVSGRG